MIASAGIKKRLDSSLIIVATAYLDSAAVALLWRVLYAFMASAIRIWQYYYIL